jgi:hypothetical protein
MLWYARRKLTEPAPDTAEESMARRRQQWDYYLYENKKGQRRWD